MGTLKSEASSSSRPTAPPGSQAEPIKSSNQKFKDQQPDPNSASVNPQPADSEVNPDPPFRQTKDLARRPQSCLCRVRDQPKRRKFSSMKNWLKNGTSSNSNRPKSSATPNPPFRQTEPGQLQSGSHVIERADGVGLYPNLDNEISVEAVREATIRSNVKMEGVN